MMRQPKFGDVLQIRNTPPPGRIRFWTRLANGRITVVIFDGRSPYIKAYDEEAIVSFGPPGPDDEEMPEWAR